MAMPAEKVNQIDLNFDPTKGRHQGNKQSIGAHRSIVSNKLQDFGRILDHLKTCGDAGATCDEIEVALGLKHQTASARCSQLKSQGIIYEAGDRRLTRSQRPAAILRVSNNYKEIPFVNL